MKVILMSILAILAVASATPVQTVMERDYSTESLLKDLKEAAGIDESIEKVHSATLSLSSPSMLAEGGTLTADPISTLKSESNSTSTSTTTTESMIEATTKVASSDERVTESPTPSHSDTSAALDPLKISSTTTASQSPSQTVLQLVIDVPSKTATFTW